MEKLSCYLEKIFTYLSICLFYLFLCANRVAYRPSPYIRRKRVEVLKSTTQSGAFLFYDRLGKLLESQEIVTRMALYGVVEMQENGFAYGIHLFPLNSCLRFSQVQL